MVETPDYDKSADPTSHASSHESGGSDVIDASGLVALSAFSVYLSANQSIPTSSNNYILWNAKLFDRANDFNLSSYRFTAPKDGTYFFTITAILHTLNDQNQFNLWLLVNAATYARITSFSATVGDLTNTLNSIIELSANDYVQVYVYHNYGSDRNLTGTIGRTVFQGYRIY